MSGHNEDDPKTSGNVNPIFTVRGYRGSVIHPRSRSRSYTRESCCIAYPGTPIQKHLKHNKNDKFGMKGKNMPCGIVSIYKAILDAEAKFYVSMLSGWCIGVMFRKYAE
jgi:hypothetical protein